MWLVGVEQHAVRPPAVQRASDSELVKHLAKECAWVARFLVCVVLVSI